jgi:hypothetical protein
MGAWRRQHKNFSNRPETCALGISPGEGEPSREFGGECLSKSFRSHRGCTRKCNRFSSDPSHPAQQDVTTKKRYSPLPSTILSILSELSRPSEVGSVGFCKPQVGGSIPLPAPLSKRSGYPRPQPRITEQPSCVIPAALAASPRVPPRAPARADHPLRPRG